MLIIPNGRLIQQDPPGKRSLNLRPEDGNNSVVIFSFFNTETRGRPNS